MSANNLQTNRNATRYFFATAEASGDQTLGLQYGTTGGSPNLSTMAVTISGGGGNGVIVNTAPSYQATDYMFAEQGLGAYGSTYFTPSTLATTVTGINLTSDRVPGSGIACIESYAGNGFTGGIEFLSRGVNGIVVSSINTQFNQWVSSIGRPGATMVMGASGTVLAGNEFEAPFFTSLNPQAGGGGRPCFGIQDLSGAGGVTPQARWAIGTTGIATGANAGSDFALFSYDDSGNFITAPMTVRRSDGAMAIGNISTISAELGGTSKGQVFPIVADNSEFGAENSTFPLAGSTSNQALYGLSFPVLFSTPVANLNPNLQSLVNINFANALSSGSNHVNYKLGFSTATAYTNIIQTSYVPGGQFSPSDLPSATTPIGHTNICAVLDPDGLSASGDGFLYVMGQLSDPGASADQLFIAKGTSSEPTRNALTYKTI
jgi:hypothetical protein